MNWIENLFIIAGVTFDIFATMEIQGSMIPQIKKRNIIIAFIVVAVLENIFFFGGYAVCYLLAQNGYIATPEEYGKIIAVVALFLLGGRLVIKAIKQEFVNERRRDGLRVWDYIKFVIVSSIYTAVAGIVCGLVGASVFSVLAIIVVVSFVMVFGGLYTGLHYGFEKKTIAYVLGAISLWGVAAEILVHKILMLL
ncbi:MAG: manganese efflux pump MntP family protein [Pseudobutyrivibrio sp.]|nr:manganese efflux pump MntP family protein [Pseudobutyrivibrio sp.]